MSEADGKTTYILTVGIEQTEYIDGRPMQALELSTMEVKDSECTAFKEIKAAQVKLSGQTVEIIDDEHKED